MDYAEHLASKAKVAEPAGFRVQIDSDWPFPFQKATTEWALHLGRAAIFADTGLGKTLMQLLWADAVVKHTGGRVLILAPLAVGPQTVREAAKFGVPDVRFVRDGAEVQDGITVCNYESMHKLSGPWAGVVLDESSILKSYMGATKRALIESYADVPYRLACTATPAPNDYLELGNHAEFLGVMSSHQMIARWFISDQSAMGTYRLKGHAVRHFWDWVSSWARCIGMPSDVGPYDDSDYELEPYKLTPHFIRVDETEGAADGLLFRKIDLSATAIHREKRRSVEARAARVAEIIAQEPDESWLVWCETNYEADALVAAIPHAVEVRGNTPTAQKETGLLDFTDRGGNPERHADALARLALYRSKARPFG